ncbi:hypothetical protein SKAU_G00175340 [Synaphobranchus kaupii]|uniref:Uncharacterized protein n=1 Tax=Synaphobranchus kaupii TaxID=118154 RepID=A0A9Q1FL90_SYNKA|nr:hypothetical protein SKAU_G00175340 [Synaphobranchus kaupii]
MSLNVSLPTSALSTHSLHLPFSTPSCSTSAPTGLLALFFSTLAHINGSGGEIRWVRIGQGPVCGLSQMRPSAVAPGCCADRLMQCDSSQAPTLLGYERDSCRSGQDEVKEGLSLGLCLESEGPTHQDHPETRGRRGWGKSSGYTWGDYSRDPGAGSLPLKQPPPRSRTLRTSRLQVLHEISQTPANRYYGLKNTLQFLYALREDALGTPSMTHVDSSGGVYVLLRFE